MKAGAENDKKTNEEVQVEKDNFGPENCIATWLHPETKHCHLETACEKVPAEVFTNHVMGLVCKDVHGMDVIHSFGKNSFKATEKFDTYIECVECHSWTPPQDQIDALSQKVTALENVIGSFTHVDFDDLSAKVRELEAFVEDAEDASDANSGGATAEGGVAAAAVRFFHWFFQIIILNDRQNEFRPEISRMSFDGRRDEFRPGISMTDRMSFDDRQNEFRPGISITGRMGFGHFDGRQDGFR